MVYKTNNSERILDFERDADPECKFIPLVVRMKLDLAKLCIHLSDWQALSREQRYTLVQFSAANSGEIDQFRNVLQNFLSSGEREFVARPSKTVSATTHAWLDATEPRSVMAIRLSAGVYAKWETLDCFGRYVLVYAAKQNDPILCRAIAAEMPTMLLVPNKNISGS
jgi:hypothetical protein